MAPKEAASGNEYNLKLLFTVLPYLEGKIPWNDVAKTLGITSGPAAAKRWSRFLVANNAAVGSAVNKKASPSTTKKNAKNSGSDSAGDDSGSGDPAEMETKKRKSITAGAKTGGKTSKKAKQEPVSEEDDDEAGFGAEVNGPEENEDV